MVELFLSFSKDDEDSDCTERTVLVADPPRMLWTDDVTVPGPFDQPLQPSMFMESDISNVGHVQVCSGLQQQPQP